jgi:hypothetical protein
MYITYGSQSITDFDKGFTNSRGLVENPKGKLQFGLSCEDHDGQD